MQSQSEERKNKYREIYEKARFENWDDFFNSARHLEDLIKEHFKHNPPVMKLVGSSSTGTMRKCHRDLDYAVAFRNTFSNDEFLDKIKSSDLNITKVKQNRKYGYFKVSGEYEDKHFVFVPMMHPNGKIETYEQDAFYHSDFINNLKRNDHLFNSILAKEFFSQLNVYKEVKGIGSELLILKYRNFDDMLDAFAENDLLRVNFSQNDSRYSTNPLIIDYPFLGGRSFTEKVTKEIYSEIQHFANKILDDPSYFVGEKNE